MVYYSFWFPTEAENKILAAYKAAVPTNAKTLNSPSSVHTVFIIFRHGVISENRQETICLQ